MINGTAIQEVIADEAKQEFQNMVAAVTVVEEAVEQVVLAVTFSKQDVTGTVLNNTIEHVIFDQIQTTVLEEMINRDVDMFTESSKTAKAKALGEWMLGNESSLGPISSLSQLNKLDAVVDKSKI